MNDIPQDLSEHQKEKIVDSRSNEGHCHASSMIILPAQRVNHHVSALISFFFVSVGSYFLVKLIFLVYNAGDALKLIIPE